MHGEGALPDAIGALGELTRLPRGSAAGLFRLSMPVSLRRGKVLYYQGERADRAYLVLSGALRRVMYRSDESTAELGEGGRGEWLGLAELMLETLYLTDAVARSATGLLAFSRQAMARALGVPGVSSYLLSALSRQLYALHGRVEVVLPLDRTVRYLAEAGRRGGGEIRCTQEEIAAAVGLRRETVNRHLAQLQADGLIRVGRGCVVLLDAGALSQRCGSGLGDAEPTAQ
jgi:CRP-like cAMP-binding protein